MQRTTKHIPDRRSLVPSLWGLGLTAAALVVISGCTDSTPGGGAGGHGAADTGQTPIGSRERSDGSALPDVGRGADLADGGWGTDLADASEDRRLPVTDEGTSLPDDGEGTSLPDDEEGTHLPIGAEGSNLVWYEATPGPSGSVISQGPGEVLSLACGSLGDPVQCEWMIQMILLSDEPLAAWAQDLTGDAADVAVLEVQSFDYQLGQFDTPAGGELFGPAPDLLINTGASSSASEGVPAGQYALVEFVLTFDFDGSDTATRLLMTNVGGSGWSDPTGAAPVIQFGDNTVVEASAGVSPPNPIITIALAVPAEICDDGLDNDGDDLIDCDDPDCFADPHCLAPPAITCPPDLTVECDGAGNTAELDAWLADVTVESVCENLTVTDDFTGLSDDCSLTGSVAVTWTATDDCGTDGCSATFTIVDTIPPTIAGPEDLGVECDGAGNTEDLEEWLAGATADDVCGDASLTDDFAGLSDDCGAAGSATVTWTATDDCDLTSEHTATFTIVDTTPPTITGPGDLTVECDGAGNTEDLEEWLAGATADDGCGDASLTDDFAGLSDDCGATGSATVTWTATDDCDLSSTHTATFTIVDTTPPTITLNGPAEMTLECHLDSYTELGAAAADNCDTDLTSAQVGGDAVDVDTPGIYVVTYDATDACDNAAEQVTRTVEVVDTLPPEVIVGDLIEIWPPNHAYWTFDLSDCVESVTDLCEGELDVDALATILSIYSDEPEDATGGGDGHTSDDIVILSDSSFKVRAERQGGGNGRVYGVAFEVSDSAGNATEALCFVGVPHDQSGDPPVDDGPTAGYTVP